MFNMTTKVWIFVLITASIIYVVDAESYSRKTLDAMILQTLWDRVYAKHDKTIKEEAIKKLKENGHYDKLVDHLQKTDKKKVHKILNLTAEIMIAYME